MAVVIMTSYSLVFGYQHFGEHLASMYRLCGLVVRVPGYTTVMYWVSCEVRTEFIYVM
jgi:hypothetical protein